MKVQIHFGGPLRDIVDGRSYVHCELTSGTSQEVIKELQALSPALHDVLFAESGATRRYIAVYHNGMGLPAGSFPQSFCDGDQLKLTLLVSGG